MHSSIDRRTTTEPLVVANGGRSSLRRCFVVERERSWWCSLANDPYASASLLEWIDERALRTHPGVKGGHDAELPVERDSPLVHSTCSTVRELV